MPSTLTRRSAIALAASTLGLAGCRQQAPVPELNAEASWDEILQLARGQTVRMAMWDGDPLINAYMRDYVAVELRKAAGVQLERIGGQGSELVNRLAVELEAGKTRGDIDVIWINGETFYQLRQLKALFGPFTDRLPNNRWIDWTNPFISVDFQQPVEGYECPWGNVQLTLIYRSDQVPSPPRTKEAIADWVRAHPGRFTWDVEFTGMTFLKSLLYDFAGGRDSLNGPFNEQVYWRSSQRLWEWIKEIRPFLWRQGETFPQGVAQLHQLFSNGELDFTMSNNDGEVDNKVLQGVLPTTAKAYVLDSGTIRNSHYLGIPVNAPNKAAAMVLIDFLITPEAQLRKAQPEVWGDGSVLSVSRLPEEWQLKFSQIPGRTRVAPRDELERSALMEPAPEVMVRLMKDFRREIIEHAT
ncbi:MAG: ABC transporter substrate-binding protein [Planctomycetaceae bacterium]